MIKVYDDNTIYIGEIIDEQRCGKGTIYFLEDFFAGYKISGNWQNNKLHGYAEITTKTYTEKGIFNNGVKTGSFLRYYNDGRCSAVEYNNDKNISEEIYTKGNKNPHNYFGTIKLSEGKYYLGDIWDGLPFGYGMIYNVDAKKNIIGESFCEIYGHRLVHCVEINKRFHGNENNLSR